MALKKLTARRADGRGASGLHARRRMRYHLWSLTFGLACWAALHGHDRVGRKLYLWSEKLWREEFAPAW